MFLIILMQTKDKPKTFLSLQILIWKVFRLDDLYSVFSLEIIVFEPQIKVVKLSTTADVIKIGYEVNSSKQLLFNHVLRTILMHRKNISTYAEVISFTVGPS